MRKRNLKKRGVAVVIRHGKVLLVKDKGKHSYSLPGGECHKGERSCQAAARELYEETRLKAKKKTWIGSFKGARSEHRACLIEAEGHVSLKTKGSKGGDELSAYTWWDMKSPLPVYPHVRILLKMLRKGTNHG